MFEAYSYCQVLGRTYQPQLSPEGLPLQLNVVTEGPRSSTVTVARRALELPHPRNWAPATDPDGEIGFGAKPMEASQWLPQLTKARKRHK